jgi:hypothetical protein
MRLEIAMAIQFNKKHLYNFTQWKQMGEGDYVLGMKPCNCSVGGRTDNGEKGTLEFLEPGESRVFNLDIEFIHGIDKINSLTKQISEL